MLVATNTTAYENRLAPVGEQRSYVITAQAGRICQILAKS